jgi:hypothetical protein
MHRRCIPPGEADRVRCTPPAVRDLYLLSYVYTDQSMHPADVDRVLHWMQLSVFTHMLHISPGIFMTFFKNDTANI